MVERQYAALHFDYCPQHDIMTKLFTCKPFSRDLTTPDHHSHGNTVQH